MGNALVYIETFGGKIRKASLAAITAAKDYASKAGGDVILAVIGNNIDSVADEVAKTGVSKVLKVQGADLENYLAEAYAQVLSQIAEAVDASAIFGTSTAQGKDLLPRLAQAIGAGMASDILEVVDEKTFKRPMYAGNVIADVEITTPKKVLSVRSTAFEHAEAGDSSAPIEDFSYSIDGSKVKTRFVKFEEIKSERPELTEAEIVISGGRGVKGPEGFKMLEELADILNAAIGASRAAVDAGWVPNDLQVGQTGKIVAPNLYIACGISGAIQHLAGMKDSKVIVAINKDPDAPIFQVADYGLVADFFKVWPEFVEKVKKLKAEEG